MPRKQTPPKPTKAPKSVKVPALTILDDAPKAPVEKDIPKVEDTLGHILDELGASVVTLTLGVANGGGYKAKLDLVTGDLCVGLGESVALATHRASQKARVFYGRFAKR